MFWVFFVKTSSGLWDLMLFEIETGVRFVQRIFGSRFYNGSLKSRVVDGTTALTTTSGVVIFIHI